MFALIDVAATGMDGDAYAHDLLEQTGVAVMPGASFGATLDALGPSRADGRGRCVRSGCRRIRSHAETRCNHPV